MTYVTKDEVILTAILVYLFTAVALFVSTGNVTLANLTAIAVALVWAGLFQLLIVDDETYELLESGELEVEDNE